MTYLSRLVESDSKFEKSLVSIDWLEDDEFVEGVGKPIRLKKSISSNSMFLLKFY